MATLRRRRKNPDSGGVDEPCDLNTLAATLREQADMLELLSGLDPDSRTLAVLRSLAVVRDATATAVNVVVAGARDGLGRGLSESEVAAAAGVSPQAVANAWGRG